MFLFSPCQVGAEATFKTEIHRLFPDFRLSYSRPGFLTFRVDHPTPDNNQISEIVSDFVNRSVFARTAAVSLGKINLEKMDTNLEKTDTETTNLEKMNIAQTERLKVLAEKIWAIAEQHQIFVNRIHVFRRDLFPPGDNGFEPSLTPELQQLHHILVAHSPKPKFLGVHHDNPNYPAQPNENILTVAETDSGYYLIGVHTISKNLPIQSRYSGGVLPITIPDNAVSRAWLKFEEGLQWSGFPIKQGDYCLDIGASPGGGSQVLLSRGAKVLGVDPAEMDPLVLNHSGFTHIQNRISQTKRSLFRNVHWIIADINVAPNYTLDVLEELAARKEIPLHGMLFTLKLFQWSLAEHLPSYLERLKHWGFDDVRVKQLVFNRQEITVAVQHRNFRLQN
jgi:23S rRNA (cytidine2498-2'-O)-methyltransferase